jgi:hypothetical protein
VTGGTLTGINGDPTTVHITTKIGIILFIIAYISIIYITIRTYPNRSYAEKGEKLSASIVAASLPFILVRIVYSVLSSFTGNPKFNFLVGSVAVNLCMAVLEEMIVFTLFLTAGFKLKVISEERTSTKAESESLVQSET